MTSTEMLRQIALSHPVDVLGIIVTMLLALALLAFLLFGSRPHDAD